MYCIKVPEGQERKELIKYSGAFLPSYVAIDPNSTLPSMQRWLG